MNDVPTRELPAASPEAQHQALLEVAEAISQHRDLGELFHELAERLHRVVDFDYLNLILHDPARNVMRLHILESEMPRNTRLGTRIPGRPNAFRAGSGKRSSLSFWMTSKRKLHLRRCCKSCERTE